MVWVVSDDRSSGQSWRPCTALRCAALLLRQSSGAALGPATSKILPLSRLALGIFFSSYQPHPSDPSRCPRTRHHQHQLHSSSLLPSPPALLRLSVHLCLVDAARPRRHTHFVTDLSLFRRANVTRPPRILQANRVVAHTSYLRSFKPFHTILPPAAPKPSGQQPAAATQAAATAPSALSTRFNSGLALVPRLDPSDSLPHTLTSSAALSLTPPPPRPHTTPCLLRTTAPLRPAFRHKISPRPSSLLPTNQVLAPHSNLDSLPSPAPRETATLLLPTGDWPQLHCSRECCSLVRGVPFANRDACAYAPKPGDYQSRKPPFASSTTTTTINLR